MKTSERKKESFLYWLLWRKTFAKNITPIINHINISIKLNIISVFIYLNHTLSAERYLNLRALREYYILKYCLGKRKITGFPVAKLNPLTYREQAGKGDSIF